MSWQPLLEGNPKDRAWASVRAIRADFSLQERDPTLDTALAGGRTGLGPHLAGGNPASSRLVTEARR